MSKYGSLGFGFGRCRGTDEFVVVAMVTRLVGVTRLVDGVEDNLWKNCLHVKRWQRFLGCVIVAVLFVVFGS